MIEHQNRLSQQTQLLSQHTLGSLHQLSQRNSNNQTYKNQHKTTSSFASNPYSQGVLDPQITQQHQEQLSVKQRIKSTVKPFTEVSNTENNSESSTQRGDLNNVMKNQSIIISSSNCVNGGGNRDVGSRSKIRQQLQKLNSKNKKTIFVIKKPQFNDLDNNLNYKKDNIDTQKLINHAMVYTNDSTKIEVKGSKNKQQVKNFSMDQSLNMGAFATSYSTSKNNNDSFNLCYVDTSDNFLSTNPYKSLFQHTVQSPIQDQLQITFDVNSKTQKLKQVGTYSVQNNSPYHRQNGGGPRHDHEGQIIQRTIVGRADCYQQVHQQKTEIINNNFKNNLLLSRGKTLLLSQINKKQSSYDPIISPRTTSGSPQFNQNGSAQKERSLQISTTVSSVRKSKVKQQRIRLGGEGQYQDYINTVKIRIQNQNMLFDQGIQQNQPTLLIDKAPKISAMVKDKKKNQSFCIQNSLYSDNNSIVIDFGREQQEQGILTTVPVGAQLREQSDERRLQNYEKYSNKWKQYQENSKKYMISRTFQSSEKQKLANRESILSKTSQYQVRQQEVEALKRSNFDHQLNLTTQMWYDSLREDNNDSKAIKSPNKGISLEPSQRREYFVPLNNQSELYARVRSVSRANTRLASACETKRILQGSHKQNKGYLNSDKVTVYSGSVLETEQNSDQILSINQNTEGAYQNSKTEHFQLRINQNQNFKSHVRAQTSTGTRCKQISLVGGIENKETGQINKRRDQYFEAMKKQYRQEMQEQLVGCPNISQLSQIKVVGQSQLQREIQGCEKIPPQHRQLIVNAQHYDKDSGEYNNLGSTMNKGSNLMKYNYNTSGPLMMTINYCETLAQDMDKKLLY